MPAVNHTAKLATSLMALLRADSGLMSLVGNRIYSGRAPQNSALPRIIWHDITSTNDPQHDGATTSDPGIDDTIVQFDIEAVTMTGVRAVADALAALLHGASPGGSPADIQAVFRESSGYDQSFDYLTSAGITEGHRRSIDYRLFWRDA